jgi:hypothetical protein
MAGLSRGRHSPFEHYAAPTAPKRGRILSVLLAFGAFDLSQKIDQPFGHRRVSEDRIA